MLEAAPAYAMNIEEPPVDNEQVYHGPLIEQSADRRSLDPTPIQLQSQAQHYREKRGEMGHGEAEPASRRPLIPSENEDSGFYPGNMAQMFKTKILNGFSAGERESTWNHFL